MMGICKFMLFTTEIRPWAMASQRTIPPKMLTNIEVTLGSPVMSVKACLIASAVAPPPTSAALSAATPAKRPVKMPTEKVCWLTTIQFYDIHRGHGEPGTID